MKNRLGFIRTTVVGGFVFLVPAVIVVVALGKLIGALKVMAKALSPVFGIETLVGGLALDMLAVSVTVLLCFVAGLQWRRFFQAGAIQLPEQRIQPYHNPSRQPRWGIPRQRICQCSSDQGNGYTSPQRTCHGLLIRMTYRSLLLIPPPNLVDSYRHSCALPFIMSIELNVLVVELEISCGIPIPPATHRRRRPSTS
jgi:hypothetical protein